MRPRTSNSESDRIPMEPSTIQKKKARADQIKAAREKYTQLSRSNLPRVAPTIPIDRPTTSRLRAPSASALPQPAASNSNERRPVISRLRAPNASLIHQPAADSFRLDPAAAAAIRAGPQACSAMIGRATTVPRPSLVARPSLVRPPLPRPSIAPRPSLMPRDGLLFAPRPSAAPTTAAAAAGAASSSSSSFEASTESYNRILRNEALPMAPGTRASSVVRRNGPSLLPGGLNIFTAMGDERTEAERLLESMTPGRSRLHRGTETTGRSRVIRFEVDSIQEQRESVGDEEESLPATSAASAAVSSSSTSSLRPMLSHQQLPIGREPTTLFGVSTGRSEQQTAAAAAVVDPPSSILKQRTSPRLVASSSSTSVVVASSSTMTVNSAVRDTGVDENAPLGRASPARTRATPNRSGSAGRRKKVDENTVMSLYASLHRINDEEWRKAPIEMINACIQKLEEKRKEKIKEEEENTEGEDTADEEESVMDRGIAIEVEEGEEEEEMHQSHALPALELTMGGTPRRRSSRLASSQGNVARSLFRD